MTDLAAQIREYLEAAAPPVTADEAIARSRARERRGDTAHRSPLLVAAVAAAAALILVGGAVIAWRVLTSGSDTGPATTLPATTLAPPTTLPPPTVETTTTAAVTTTTGEAVQLGTPASDPLPDPIAIDASLVAGDLPAPEGWTIYPCGGSVLCIHDGGTCDPPEEGEVCNTLAPGAVYVEVYPADRVPGWDVLLAASGAEGAEDAAAIRVALRGWVADYYASIEARWEHWKWEFDPYDPAPADVGGLPGLHFGYGGRDGAETSQHTDAYVACDGVYLYVIKVRSPEIAPEAEATGGVEAFAPYLQQIVADLRLPLSFEDPAPPVLNENWALESGDVLVSGEAGITILRGPRGRRQSVGTITNTPVTHAYHDRMGGVVLGQAHPTQASGVLPGEAAVWWVPGPGAEPIVLHRPEPGERTTLYGVAVVGGPAALYTTTRPGDYFAEEVLVAHDLRTGEVREVTVASVGEVRTDCASWGPGGMLLTVTAETNLWFEMVDARGIQVEGFTALDYLRSEDNPHSSVCAAQRESDGMIVVALRTWEGPNELVLITSAAGEVRRIVIDAEMNGGMAQSEMLPNFWLDTRLDFWEGRVAISILGLSEPYLVHLDDGEIEFLSIEGVASFVP